MARNTSLVAKKWDSISQKIYQHLWTTKCPFIDGNWILLKIGNTIFSLCDFYHMLLNKSNIIYIIEYHMLVQSVNQSWQMNKQLVGVNIRFRWRKLINYSSCRTIFFWYSEWLIQLQIHTFVIHQCKCSYRDTLLMFVELIWAFTKSYLFNNKSCKMSHIVS